MIVAVNQNSTVTAQSYSQLESAVRNAVCHEVEWAEIEPYWFFEIVE